MADPPFPHLSAEARSAKGDSPTLPFPRSPQRRNAFLLAGPARPFYKKRMQVIFIPALLVVLAYLLGAIPTGLLLCRMQGIDIRGVGSGNIGATNVFRTVSKKLGIITLIADALKGFLPTFFFPAIATVLLETPPGAGFALLCGLAAVVGHNWPVYLGFRGGKGVATTAGVLLGIAPPAMLIGMSGFIFLLLITDYVAVGSMGASVCVAASAWWLYLDEGLLLPSAFTLLALLIIWQHRGNIQRLLNGTEHRFELGKREGTTNEHE